uniref:ATP synthase F0 subunit 8 n=1 Tax=Echinoderes svetlanae TaxID=1912903 RepID=A0A1I9VTU1_9BILA|nr:ATP synthase F0 subunit 8 [Echinoderes svetlanae]APA17414.1 ATP synthase F0 subunit 8 [Echinoderes svetlanae]
MPQLGPYSGLFTMFFISLWFISLNFYINFYSYMFPILHLDISSKETTSSFKVFN